MPKRFLLVFAALAAALGAAHADAPKPDFTNLPAYIQALDASTNPQAVAIRQEIANGPDALAKARAAAQAAGISLTFAPPDVPADQNAAPLYDQWRQAQKQSSTPYLPEYAEVLSPRNTYTPEQLARVQQFFDANRAATALLHQAAEKPALAYPKPTTDPSTFTHYAPLREAERELVTESYLLAHDGSYTGAVADQANGFQIAKQLMTQPSLLNYLVADAMEAITLGGIQNILHLAGPNAAVDAQVEKTVQSALPVLSVKAALTGEVANSLPELDMLRAATPKALASLTAQNGDQLSPNLPKTFTPEQQTFLNNVVDAVEAHYLTEMQQLILASGTPAQDVVFAAAQSQAGAAPGSPVGTLDPITIISSILGGVYGQLGRIANRTGADEQVTLAAAAVLEAKAKIGVFPTALPGDFPDPFSGQPLGYRPEGDTGFVVYSVGPDRTFHGGQPGQYDFGSPQTFFRYPGPPPQPVPANMLK